MVRHGTQKKRRSGNSKVQLKRKEHRNVRVVKAIKNLGVKEVYDKTKSPAENLRSFGLVSDANTLGKEPKAKTKCAAFVGFAELPTPKVYKPLSDEDKAYAQACIEKYGKNYVKMTRDIATNYNQLTAHKLEKLCVKYEAELEMELDC